MKHLKRELFLILILAVLSFSSCQQEKGKADLIISNANIWTGNENQKMATTMAIVGDTILAIGTEEEVWKYNGKKTTVIDAKGRFITPGFIDSHVHLMTGGRSLLNVDLRDADTQAEFSKRVGDFAKTIPAKQWIMEGNWDHTLWGGDLPKKEWIDEVTPNNPVLIMRLDWHMALANSAALKFAGIDKNTPDVDGGTIERDENGEPTGLLKDNAMNLILDKIPPMSPELKKASFQAAMDYFLSNGVTTVHDVDGFNKDFESWSTAEQFKAANDLKVRIYGAYPLNEWKTLAESNHQDDNWLKTGCLKGFVDGSLGSHTAAFHHGYTDKPEDKGFFINTEDDLYQWISNADKANLQIFVHAIGDKAIHVLLNTYEQIVAENGKRDRRLRIEHAQHIAPEDIKRFAELGIIASMQPYHAIDDGRWAEEYIGSERIKTTYAFKSLMDSKASVTFGSDWAVAPASPIQGIYAAVTRQTLDGKNPNGWIPEQKITAEQALLAYTKNAAYASFDENVKGTLEAGKLADFVILSEDIRKVEPSKIRDVEVVATYVGGKKMFDSEKK